MDKNIGRTSIISNMLWRFAERCGAQFVTFFVSVILARMLDPSAYGTIALIAVFTTILEIFINSGLGNALIQKKDADDLDFSTVFYTNIVFCLVIYAGLYIAAPYISEFYGMPDLTPLTRVLGLTLIISGVKNVEMAYVSKHMQFKIFFFATLGGTLGASVVGIVMAYMGLGAWALIGQSLFNNLVDTIILWVVVKWRPQRVFSFERLKKLYSFGWKLLLTNLINTVYNDIQQLVIGKVYTTSDLAYYNKAKQMPQLIISNINSSIDSVLFPAMSAEQDDKSRVKEMTRMAIRTSSFIIWPCMIGLAAVSTPLIKLLLTEKWLPSVPYMRIFCFVYAFQPIHSANLNAIKAMGRSDITLKLEIIKKSFGIALLIAVMPYGPYAICCSVILYSIVTQILNSFPNKKLLDYSYLEQLKDIMPFIGMSAIMCAAVVLVGLIPCPDIAKLIIQVITGVGVYVFESKVFRVEEFQTALDTIKRLIRK